MTKFIYIYMLLKYTHRLPSDTSPLTS